jgi:hypothetical protein
MNPYDDILEQSFLSRQREGEREKRDTQRLRNNNKAGYEGIRAQSCMWSSERI